MVPDLVIFDFDDTLVRSYPIFLLYEEQFVMEMVELGFSDTCAVRNFFRAQDIALVTEAGYPAADCFPRAMSATYRHFSAIAGRNAEPVVAARLEEIGWNVHFDPPSHSPGVRDVLDTLYGQVRMIVFSQGETRSQLRRIEASGLQDYFLSCHVTHRKTPDAYRQLLAVYRAEPGKSWMVGNSLKSDVNPALAIGMNVIHYDTDDWSFDQEESQGKYYRVTRLTEIPELVLS